MVGIWRKLVAGSESRPTRLHDALGQRASISRVFRNLPRAFASGALRVAWGRLPERPWISYDAQRHIAAFLASRPGARVLEFGSGQSTRWYAERCAHLVSVESNSEWHARISRQLSGLSHVDYRAAPEREAFASPELDGLYDLVMIDGPWRDACVDTALRVLAPGGIIYLDNSDKADNPSEGDVPAARCEFIAFAEREGLPWREFSDFAPAQFFVQRGLMVGPGVTRPN
ncbi:MAG: class I SAM-dependent methyltransferase [Qipengyuania sp.]